MKLMSWIACIGAVVGLAVIAALYFIVGFGWLFAGILTVGVVVSYIVAALGNLSLERTNAFGEFMRGWLVGMNASANAFMLLALFSAAGSAVAGGVLGGVLGLICTVSVVKPISQSEFYQGVIGWMNWLLPMSWLIVVLGFLFYLVSLILHAVTAGKVAYLKIKAFAADWSTGTFFMHGGLIANLNPIDTAFNMGNFSFVDRESDEMHIEHEAGHTLNLAAFGCWFHLIGALDENATPRGANAYSERLAESNHSTGGSTIPMWA